MPTTDSDIQASLDAVIEDVERNEQIYGWFAGNVGQLARATRALDAKVDKGFARVEARFAQVDDRFAQVDARFAQVDQRFDRLEQHMDTRFGLVEDQLRKIDARMERLVRYIVRDELDEETTESVMPS